MSKWKIIAALFMSIPKSTFMSWALYFLAGCEIKGGVKVLCGYVMGILGSILIIMFGDSMMESIGFFAFPLAVGVIAFCIMFLEHTTWLSLIPAIFVASGCFFGLINFAADGYLGENLFMEAFKLEMIYAVIGVIFGVITITLKGKLDACLGADEAEE